MPADATLAKGTALFFSTNGTSYTQLIDCPKIGAPASADAPDVDVTPVDTTSDYRETLKGLLSHKSMTFEQLFTAARYEALEALRLVQGTYWRVRLPDGSSPASGSRFDWQGTLETLQLKEIDNPDSTLVIDGGIKASGTITFTAAT